MISRFVWSRSMLCLMVKKAGEGSGVKTCAEQASRLLPLPLLPPGRLPAARGGISGTGLLPRRQYDERRNGAGPIGQGQRLIPQGHAIVPLNQPAQQFVRAEVNVNAGIESHLIPQAHHVLREVGQQDVALAINVAWGEESLPGLLDVFGKEDVRATFFFIGDWARKFPELVQAVAADGHEVGNHGLYHGHPCALSREDLSRMILENNVLLAKIIGRQPSPLFAPPAGEFNQRSVGVAADLGYRTILWTVDTIDWKRPSPDLIHARVVNKVLNGAIILMHPTAPTLVALPGLIKALREKGFRFVTVGEMLGRH